MPGRQEGKTRAMDAAIRIAPGSAGDAPALLALFDDAVAWLTARGQTGQWGSDPFSTNPRRRESAQGWASGGGLWFAHAPDGARAGAIVVGEAPDYVPPADVPELYVLVLLTAGAYRGAGVGAALIEHAAALARERGAQRLRIDCWDGVPELPAAYVRLGFTRTGSFDVGGWPGAVLQRPVG
jgi:GNAT superfamily N-acetyltransferase